MKSLPAVLFFLCSSVTLADVAALYPLDLDGNRYVVKSDFGPRKLDKGFEIHEGVDFANRPYFADPVNSLEDGTVDDIGEMGTGNGDIYNIIRFLT